MNCERLNYYLEIMECQKDDPHFNQIKLTGNLQKIEDIIPSDVKEKLERNTKLMKLADATKIAGCIVTIVNLVPYLDKASVLGSTLSEIYAVTNLIGLENTPYIIDGTIGAIKFLDEMDLLLDGMGMAADALDLVEALSTLGLSVAASWIAKTASEKANQEKEETLKKLQQKTKSKAQMIQILAKEKNYLKRNHDLGVLMEKLTLNMVF